MQTRREFTRATLAGLVLPTLVGRHAFGTPIGGVRLGVQTYSFRELRPASGDSVDVVIKAMTECGLGECELWSPQIEPVGRAAAPATPEDRARARAELRAWRVSGPRGHFAAARKKFETAGISVFAYNLSFNDTFTDEEIEHGFQEARELGAKAITASTTVSVARRLVPFAERHRMPVAMHNHSQVNDPNEFATPLSFTTALAMSPMFRINLDIGHFTAGNNDAMAFLQQHHDRIACLHLKDRKKNQGDNTPWGQGDTPIREVLTWLKQTRSSIPAYIEYEYKGDKGAVGEVKACLEYATRILLPAAR
jgi:sugar phosphate isomerase/epimerase